MSRDIYLVGSAGELIRMSEEPYRAESELQQWLAACPELLSESKGDESQWLLVAREPGIPGEEAGKARWAVDHLFLDAEGVPTLVEVKRSTDTRIRREVVGQMLDYATNAVLYMTLDQLIEDFETGCNARGVDPEEEIATHTSFADPERFWDQVSTNLRAGKIRLIFVADRIPTELQRIVEFLNEQMSEAEVLAIEVRKHAGAGKQALVPRLLGRTAQAKARKRKYRGASLSPELRDIILEYHRSTETSWHHSANGRLIYPWEPNRGVHYEFTQPSEAVGGVELHIEGEWGLPARGVLAELEGAAAGEATLQWDPHYWKGLGRVYVEIALNAGPSAIAEVMVDLTDLTYGPVDEALKNRRAL